MADLSQIIVNNITYNIKDPTARSQLSTIQGSLATLDNIVEGQFQNGSFYQIQTTAVDYVEIDGLKWATMNVGANSVTDTGLYFQWGDISGYTASQVGSGEGQKYFGWADYKYNPSGDGSTMTKYNSTDGYTTLLAEDDAATAAWGGDWRMPTTAEFQALGAATTSAWTADYEGSGVAGLILTDKNDLSKVLFFPAAGYCSDGSFYDGGSDGYYWSSSLYASNVGRAYRMRFDSSYVNWQNSSYRCNGFSVRGIWDGQETPTRTIQVTPESGKIYVDTTTNKLYRYNGSVYVEVSPGSIQIQSNWEQTNTAALDYIKNKPIIEPTSSAGQNWANFNIR